MEVKKLTKALVPRLDGYLRRNPVKDAYLIHDLWEERNDSGFYLALEGSDIKGTLLVYRGYVEGPSAIIRGGVEAASTLMEKFPEEERTKLISCKAPSKTSRNIKPYLTVESKCSGKILSLDRFTEKDLSQTSSTELTKGDSNALARLWSDWIGGCYDELLESIKKNMASPKNTYFGLRKGDKGLVSAAYTTRVPPDVAIIRAVYTNPKYRNQGYGTSVVAKAIEKELRSVDKICLTLRGKNPAASHLYEKLGFSKSWKFDWFILN